MLVPSVGPSSYFFLVVYSARESRIERAVCLSASFGKGLGLIEDEGLNLTFFGGGGVDRV